MSETTLLFVGRDRSVAHSSESPLLWLILAPPSITRCGLRRAFPHCSPPPPNTRTHNTHTHTHTWSLSYQLTLQTSCFVMCITSVIAYLMAFSHIRFTSPGRAGAHSLLYTALFPAQKGPQSKEQGQRKWCHSESPLCLALNKMTIPDDLIGSSSIWVTGGAAAGYRVRKQGLRFNFILS